MLGLKIIFPADENSTVVPGALGFSKYGVHRKLSEEQPYRNRTYWYPGRWNCKPKSYHIPGNTLRTCSSQVFHFYRDAGQLIVNSRFHGFNPDDISFGVLSLWIIEVDTSMPYDIRYDKCVCTRFRFMKKVEVKRGESITEAIKMF